MTNKVKQLHFGLVCPQDIAPQVLWFIHLQFFGPQLWSSSFFLYFSLHCIVWPSSNCPKCFSPVNNLSRCRASNFNLFENGFITSSRSRRLFSLCTSKKNRISFSCPSRESGTKEINDKDEIMKYQTRKLCKQPSYISKSNINPI